MEPQGTWRFKRQMEKRSQRDQEAHGVTEMEKFQRIHDQTQIR